MRSPTKTAQRTPTPWKVSLTDDTMIVDATGREVAAIDGDYNNPDEWPLMEANAAFIVKAVNNHSALVEALTTLLPMAKGYAHANQVGRNGEMVAEALLKALED